jgi:putative flippase GtrA
MPPAVQALWDTYGRIVRFVISGGTAAAVHLGLVFILVHFFSWYPVFASVCAFVIAFFVSFALQKLWTYKNFDRKNAGEQMGTYLAIQLANLGLNALSMYIFVEYTNVHYLVAQVITSGTIAIESFFVYKYFVFHSRPQAQESA